VRQSCIVYSWRSDIQSQRGDLHSQQGVIANNSSSNKPKYSSRTQCCTVSENVIQVKKIFHHFIQTNYFFKLKVAAGR
jgi:hypothetical protein